MFELKHIKGNTYYFEAFTNVGVYLLNEKEVILIDSCDHKRMVKTLDYILSEKGLRVKTIISTHCHVDHICGNRYFFDKYGCNILSTKKEKAFIAVPDMEPKFYYNGIDVNELSNPFFGIEPTESEVFSPENIPEGFDIIDLPGHSFEMVGVRTPDNIVFLADALLSHDTWEGHRMPFFFDVNKSIETLKALPLIKGDLFVPSHNEPLEDITELSKYNLEKLENLKKLTLDLCEGSSFEDLFDKMMAALDLNIKTTRYPMYAQMLRNYLQALVNDNKIKGILESNRLIYHIK